MDGSGGPETHDVAIVPEESDFVSASMLLYWARYRVLIILSVLATIPLSLLLLRLRGPIGLDEIALSVVLAPLAAWGNVAYTRRRVRRIWVSTAILRVPYSLTWDDSGFAVASGESHHRGAWDELVDWLENDDVVVLPISKYYFRYFPRRFLSASDYASLRRHVLTKA